MQGFFLVEKIRKQRKSEDYYPRDPKRDKSKDKHKQFRQARDQKRNYE